jgi:hypothetical protein
VLVAEARRRGRAAAASVRDEVRRQAYFIGALGVVAACDEGAVMSCVEHVPLVAQHPAQG